MRARIQAWLSARHAPLIVVGVGLVLASSALRAGFVADDHHQRVIARDDPGIEGLESRPMDLFVFASGEATEMRALMDAGVFPWWTDPTAKLAFMRPVSSLTHAFDRALWPGSPTLMLAHNLLWLALALAAVWLFYRRFMDVRWMAVLALLLYAIDDARGPPVGWIANRNTFIALALAIPALLAYDRWRREGWRPGRWLGPAVLGIALLAGEAALAIGAYLAAHAVHLDRGRWRDRVLALLPYLLVVVVWRVAYDALGYGVSGSGIYVDPRSQPLEFVQIALERLPLLLLGQLGLPWSDLGSLYPMLGDPVVYAMLAIAVAFLALCAFALAPLWRADPVTRFFTTGMLLAAVPICSTFPADRLLGFVGLGAMGVLARLFGAALDQRRALGRTVARRVLALVVVALLVLVHVVLAPPLLWARAQSMVTIGRILDRADATIPKTEAVRDATVILANTPADPLAGYVPIMRASRREPGPAHLRWLATGATPVTYERIDPRTLRVTPDEGFLRYRIDHMLTRPDRDFHVGDRVELSGLTIEIAALTADGRPGSIDARFDRPLDAPDLVWLRWGERGYVPWQPPAPGERDRLERVDLLPLILERPEADEIP